MKTKSDAFIPFHKNYAFYLVLGFVLAIIVLVAFPDGFIVKTPKEVYEQNGRQNTDTVLRVTAVYCWDGFTNSVIARKTAKRKLFMNGYIAVEVNNIKRLDSLVTYEERVPRLYFNNVALKSLSYSLIDSDNGFVIYYLDQADSSLSQCDAYFKNMFSPWVINRISLGFDGEKPFKTDVYGYALYPIDRNAFWVMLCMIGFVICVFVVLTRSSTLLKVASTDSQFSLAYTQIAFWTLIVIISYLYLWMSTQEYNTLTASALIIMGISTATTSGSRLISKRMQQKRLAEDQSATNDQDKQGEAVFIRPSKGFFSDLFCDDNGSSISRMQMILWTLIMGVVFIWVVIKEKQMPEFSDSQLLLIGISSGAYLLLKPFDQYKTKQ